MYLTRGFGDLENRIATQLFTLMDSLQPDVVVLATTNIPDSLDPSLRRRFDYEFKIDLPDRAGRLEILELCTKTMTLASDVMLEEIAEATDAFVSADLARLCQHAFTTRVLHLHSKGFNNEIVIPRDLKPEVTMDDFRAALLTESKKRASVVTTANVVPK